MFFREIGYQVNTAIRKEVAFRGLEGLGSLPGSGLKKSVPGG